MPSVNVELVARLYELWNDGSSEKAVRLRWFTQAEQGLEAVGLPRQTGDC